jgi:hypothetical protein
MSGPPTAWRSWMTKWSVASSHIDNVDAESSYLSHCPTLSSDDSYSELKKFPMRINPPPKSAGKVMRSRLCTKSRET